MKFLKKLSIRSKLIGILLVLSSLLLILGFAVVITRDIATFRNQLVENGIMIARVIGDYSIVDLTFGDQKASKETLAKLSSIEQVHCALLYDLQGNVFSTYPGTDCSPGTSHPMPVRFGENFLHVSQPIQDQDRKYGTIYLRVSLASLNQKIKSYLLTMILLLGALVILSYFLATRLQRLISTPLLELASATRKITEERDYSIRLHVDSSDEMGILFDGFNQMLTQLEKRKRERDQAEQALRESEHRYRILVESSPVGVFLEQDSSIVYVNPAGYKLTGCDSIAELESIGLLSELQNARTPANSTAIPEECSIHRKDGTQTDIGILSGETTHDGKPAVQYLVRDITESKSLRQAAERMERLAAVGEFSAMLAHEIRNSIGSVALNVRLLSERMAVPDRFRKNLQNVELGVQRMQEIIKAILNFARPAVPRLQKVSINKLVDSSVHLVEQELEENGIVLERQQDPSDPSVEADVDQIGQVLMNLFLNASHAMDQGGKIVVKTIERKDGVAVQVIDNGKGIPPENVDKIFNPFFTTSGKGVGLGLAFVSRILEKHNATISVESVPGERTVFTIVFPKQWRTHGKFEQQEER